MAPAFVFLWPIFFGTGFATYSPFLDRNVNMAVVIDNALFPYEDDYRDALETVSNLITDIINKEMQVSDLRVHVFQDATINLRQDYTVLLSVATCNRTWHLHGMARKEKLVHLAITDKDCSRIPKSEGISIPMITPGEELTQIFLDLRVDNVLSWKKIIVLYDDIFGKENIKGIVEVMSQKMEYKKSKMITKSVFSFNHDHPEWIRKQHIRQLLTSFKVVDLGNCYLAIVSVDTVADVMEIARSLKMVHPGSQWLYVIADTAIHNITDITSLTLLLAEGGNVAFLYNVTNVDNVCNSGFSCYIKESLRALMKVIRKSFINEFELYENGTDPDFEVIKLTKLEKQRNILEGLRVELFRSPSSVGKKCSKCLLWRFSSAIAWGNFYLHGKNMAYLIDSGTWTPERGVNLTDAIFPHIEHGFRGIRLPVVTFHNPPWQIITQTESDGTVYSGPVFEVLKYLSRKLNFTYTVINPLNESMAMSYDTSNPTRKIGIESYGTMVTSTRRLPVEVVDLVHSNKVLLAACAYTVNEYKKASINFTLPIFVQTYSFLTSKPGQLSRALLFTSPFTGETWACLGAAIIIMGPILYLVHKYSPYSTEISGLNSSWQCVWYVYGALLQQGGMYLPQSDSARLLVGVWWLIVMVLVATYSGSLIAFLTFPKMDMSILTVEDILAYSGKITWGFPRDSFLEEYLENFGEGKYHLFLSRAERHNLTEELDIIRRIKEGKHIFIDWKSSLRMLMRKDLSLSGKCHFSLSTDEFVDEPIALIVSHDNPYLSIINSEIHRILESGLMNKWISEKMPMKDKCWEGVNHIDVVDKRKVNVADMQGIFFVLFMGIILSIFLLCCEFFWHYRKLSKERRLIRPFVS